MSSDSQCGSKHSSPDSWSDLIFLRLWLGNSLIVSFKGPILVTQLEVSQQPCFIEITGSYLWLFTSFTQLDHNPACHRFVCPILESYSRKKWKCFFLRGSLLKASSVSGVIWFTAHSRLSLKNCRSHFLPNLYHKYGLYCYFNFLRYTLLYGFFKSTCDYTFSAKIKAFQGNMSKNSSPT